MPFRMIDLARRLWSRPAVPTPVPARRTRLAVEDLEGRGVPAAIPTVGPNGGTLVLVDTLTVPLANASGVHSSTALEVGANYIAVASVTARIARDKTGTADA